MTLFLHIGSHKTGTTAIQDFASMNAGWLAGRGLLYPSYELIGGKRERSHLGAVDALVRGGVAGAEARRMLEAGAAAAGQGGQDILLSAESLFRLNDEARARVCEALTEIFGGMVIRVTCALRPQTEFAESLYRNGYRAFAKVPPPFDLWLGQSAARFDYAETVTAYLGALGATPLLLPYSGATRKDFVARFFSALGVTELSDAGGGVRQKNPSLDAIECLAKLRVMDVQPLDPLLSKAFNNFAFKSPIETAYGFLDRTREEALLAGLEVGNLRLIEMEPALRSVLGADLPVLGRAPLDGEADALAHERVEAFKRARS